MIRDGAGAAPIVAPGAWARLLVGLAAVYFACLWTAEALGSHRGEWGLVVMLLALAGLTLAEATLFARPPPASWGGIGLGRPAIFGIAAAAALCALLLLILPVYLAITGERARLHPGAALLALGIFLQAGVFEEALFRGYLFGRLRVGRSFWAAAGLASLPFAAVHLPMFATQPPEVASVAIALAVALSFPLARLYELGGDTIWAPALVHAMVQGALKLVVFDRAEALTMLAVIWMLAAAALPWLVFAIPQRKRAEGA
jgi:membrane protease YdiL (CAAX protease family)